MVKEHKFDKNHTHHGFKPASAEECPEFCAMEKCESSDEECMNACQEKCTEMVKEHKFDKHHKGPKDFGFKPESAEQCPEFCEIENPKDCEDGDEACWSLCHERCSKMVARHAEGKDRKDRKGDKDHKGKGDWKEDGKKGHRDHHDHDDRDWDEEWEDEMGESVALMNVDDRHHREQYDSKRGPSSMYVKMPEAEAEALLENEDAPQMICNLLPRKYVEGGCDIVIRRADCAKTMVVVTNGHPTIGAVALGGFGLIAACMACCGLKAARLRHEERRLQRKSKFNVKKFQISDSARTTQNLAPSDSVSAKGVSKEKEWDTISNVSTNSTVCTAPTVTKGRPSF
jgi:hypothetical protein